MKKSNNSPEHKFDLIDTPEALESFASLHKNAEWLGFDTEFIGERRFYTLLCLIQVSSDQGYYIIDAIKLKRLDPLFDLLTDDKIIKITHAGENDYRLLYQQYKLIPKNLFDTQVAAGFIGYRYPLSFAKLVGRETNHRLGKGFTVSNWESRPLTDKQIKYALEDIIPLRELHQKLTDKLEKLSRLDWFKQEMGKYEVPGLFEHNPYKEAFQNNLISGRSTKEQVFLLRLYKWRTDLARSRDHSKEMVMPSKFISFILKNIKSGKAALLGHRRLPPDIVKKNWDTFKNLYESPVTPEEEEILAKLPPSTKLGNNEDVTFDLLSNLIKFHCQNISLAPDLLFVGVNVKRMRLDRSYFDEKLIAGWRSEIMGAGIINALKNQNGVKISLNDQEAVIDFNN